MKRIEFTPKACKGTETEPAAFEGKVIVRVPTLPERYEILEKLGLDYDAAGAVTMEKSAFAIMRILISESEKFYETVDLKKLSDGSRFVSFAELVSDPDCDEIVTEIANEIKQGFKPSKKIESLVKQQVQWIYAGTGKTNDCWHYVSEYLEMEWLKKLGFTRDVAKLDVIKAALFVTIGSEFQRLGELDKKKKSKG